MSKVATSDRAADVVAAFQPDASRFGHGATDTLVKAATRARELVAAAIDGVEKEKEKLQQETEEVRSCTPSSPHLSFEPFANSNKLHLLHL